MTSNKWWTNFHLPWGFYEASPNASITAELLVAMIQFLDDLNVFNQTIAKSFLLLDGHHSRMSLLSSSNLMTPSTIGWCALEFHMRHMCGNQIMLKG
jgi:hypothetical protein